MTDSAQPRWIPTNIGAHQFERQLEIDGRTLRVYLSPYDVPRALSAHKEGRFFKVFFDYPGGRTEATDPEGAGPVTFSIGRESGRLMMLRVDVPALMKEVGETVDLELVVPPDQIYSALDKVKASLPIEAARAALKENPQIFNSLTSSS